MLRRMDDEARHEREPPDQALVCQSRRPEWAREVEKPSYWIHIAVGTSRAPSARSFYRSCYPGVSGRHGSLHPRLPSTTLRVTIEASKEMTSSGQDVGKR